MADEEAGVLLLLQDELYAQYSRGSLHSLHVSTAVADGCLVHADKTMILMEILPHFSPLKWQREKALKKTKMKNATTI